MPTPTTAAASQREFGATAIADPHAATILAPGLALDARTATQLIDQHHAAVAADIAVLLIVVVRLATEDLVIVVVVVPVMPGLCRAGHQ